MANRNQRTLLFLALFFAGVGFAGLMGAEDHDALQNMGNYIAGIGAGGFIWGRGPMLPARTLRLSEDERGLKVDAYLDPVHPRPNDDHTRTGTPEDPMKHTYQGGRAPKASDIEDRDMLAAVAELVVESGGCWTNTTAVAERYQQFPEKVVAAKLSRLYRRGLLSGCDCGCRGDWELTDAGRIALLMLACGLRVR